MKKVKIYLNEVYMSNKNQYNTNTDNYANKSYFFATYDKKQSQRIFDDLAAYVVSYTKNILYTDNQMVLHADISLGFNSKIHSALILNNHPNGKQIVKTIIFENEKHEIIKFDELITEYTVTYTEQLSDLNNRLIMVIDYKKGVRKLYTEANKDDISRIISSKYIYHSTTNLNNNGRIIKFNNANKSYALIELKLDNLIKKELLQ